ncbi:MAG TPA: hypothetical protein PLZ08_09140 [Bacillota bacterium]|nr:hypothetical protein [Bacillota bacterium]HOL10308.1 hypothetical protein [Bacillota bacterium]HPO98102.1 hypothetical protein [Bacillota bacterium]
MKKLIAVASVAILLVMMTGGLTFANALTLQAENGQLLKPAGLEVNAVGLASLENVKNVKNINDLDNYQLQVSYGISRLITVTGSIEKDQGYQRLMGRAFYSPSSDALGYTIYGGYDLTNFQLAEYGVSLWADWRMFRAFVNLESDLDQDNNRFYRVSPGANVRVTSNIGIAAELAMNPEDWSLESVSAGVNYRFNKNLSAKFYVVEQLDDQKDRLYNTGLSVQL